MTPPSQPTPGPYFLGRHVSWTHCGCEPRVSLNDGTYGMTMIAYCPTHAAAPEMLELIREALAVDDVDPSTWNPRARALLARIAGKEAV